MNSLEASELPLEKRCIFCGNRPDDKNKEHVIPRWLIELTGKPKRTWHLGVKFNLEGKPDRQFSADQFQFPACEQCNLRYSDLEGRTKANVTKLLNGQNLNAAEWDDFLDWFDKVRVGLWIGNMILNKDLPTPTPKFFIDQRVGVKDRCVLVYPIKDDHVGLRMVGASDPSFFYTPTSFALLINNLLFVNISSDFLLAPRMGFPFPRKITTVGVKSRADDFTAQFRMKIPFIRFSFYSASVAVYQTILTRELLDDESYTELAKADYVKSRLWPGSPIKTKLCAFENSSPVFLSPAEDVPRRELNENEIKTYDDYCIRLFEYRRFHLESMLKTGELEASKKLVRLMIKFNGYALDQTKSGIYSI